MLKLFAKTAAALSLMLSASVAVPAWAGSSVDHRKCTGAAQSHAKRSVAAPARKATPPRGAGVAQLRRTDVQVLTYGP